MGEYQVIAERVKVQHESSSSKSKQIRGRASSSSSKRDSNLVQTAHLLSYLFLALNCQEQAYGIFVVSAEYNLANTAHLRWLLSLKR